MSANPPLRNGMYRPQRMSLADAIQALERLEASKEAECKIVVRPWIAQNGIKTSLVQVRAIDPSGQHYRVPMPSADRFSAKTTLDIQIEREISVLDEARFDMDGNVTLANGMHLHALKIVPTPLVFELTAQQNQILRLTIAYLRAEAHCYRLIAPRDPTLRVFVLDFGKVQDLKLKSSLKALERYILLSGLDVSRQAIDDALAAAGMRLPRSGKRSEKALAAFSSQ